MIEFFEGVDSANGLRVAIAYSATSHIKRVEEQPVRQNQPDSVTIRTADSSHSIVGSYDQAMAIIAGPVNPLEYGPLVPDVEPLPASVRAAQRASAIEQRQAIAAMRKKKIKKK